MHLQKVKVMKKALLGLIHSSFMSLIIFPKYQRGEGGNIFFVVTHTEVNMSLQWEDELVVKHIKEFRKMSVESQSALHLQQALAALEDGNMCNFEVALVFLSKNRELSTEEFKEFAKRLQKHPSEGSEGSFFGTSFKTESDKAYCLFRVWRVCKLKPGFLSLAVISPYDHSQEMIHVYDELVNAMDSWVPPVFKKRL